MGQLPDLGHSSFVLGQPKNGASHASGISSPKPGASDGMSPPFTGNAMPGMRQHSSSGTPGGVPTKYSHQGEEGVAKVKCCPYGFSHRRAGSR